MPSLRKPGKQTELDNAQDRGRRGGSPGIGDTLGRENVTVRLQRQQGKSHPEPGDSRMDDGVSPEPLYATQREACKEDGWEDRANTDAEVG